MRDLIEDGINGILVPPGAITPLRAALERLLADGELRRRLGEAARATALDRLSWETWTRATVAALQSAL